MSKKVEEVKSSLEKSFAKKPIQVGQVLKVAVPVVYSSGILALAELIEAKKCDVELRRSGTSVTVLATIS